VKNKNQRGVVTIEMNGQTFRAEVELGSSYSDAMNGDGRRFTFGFLADSPEAYKAMNAYCREHMNARKAAEKSEQNG